MGPSVVLVHIIVVAPSPSSFHPVSVVVSSVIPSRRGSSRRFIRHPQRVPFPFARRYSFRRRSAPRRRLIRRLVPRRRLIRRRLAASCAVPPCSSLVTSSLVPLFVPSFLVPRPVARFVHHSSARSFSPFLDTMGGAFSHSIARRVSKHEGVAGRGIAMGVAR